MKLFFSFALLPFLVVLCGKATQINNPMGDTTSFAPVAVVELFTSEGCSSCPPADAVLSKLVAEAAADDKAVFALSFHVDYWNYLGWNDPFSEEAYSQRQRQYAKELGSTVYTPQMVVNGQVQFVGSRERDAQDYVRRALSREATTQITGTATASPDGKSIKVSYQTVGATPSQHLHLALVERNVSVAVKRGENRGRELHHDNVVRAYLTQTAAPTGEVTLSIPASATDRSALSIIAYTQEGDSGLITGASRVDW